jgi:catechol 2,3-dioxygenase-like lactoylglutathione lyase family enzyme
MLDHFGVRLRDSDASLPLYRACLPPLGITVIQEQPEWKAVIFMQQGSSIFMWIGQGDPEWLAKNAEPRTHIGFRAKTPQAVDEFYAAAMAAGGRDNGPPGYRSPTIYSAFVFDPDGNNIEAIHQTDRPFRD